MDLIAPQTPPDFCQYVQGPCNQAFFDEPSIRTVFMVYPGNPPQPAEAIEIAQEALAHDSRGIHWQTWKGMSIAGQLIFCEVCKTMRASHVLVADITTLNFNLLYEIGFALGLGIPIVPIRDTTFVIDKTDFERLGLLSTLGYEDYHNSQDLISLLPDKVASARPMPDIPTRAFREAPIYIIKPPTMTDGALQLEATLKKSRLRYRTFDPAETIRLSVNEARRQVNGSSAVMATLLPSSREGHRVHNALCAFVAGYAMSRGLIVTLLQDGDERHAPIDYRDVVQSYASSREIPRILQPTLNAIYDIIQSGRFNSPEAKNLGVLLDLDLGDVAAENEIGGLRYYFVPTGASIMARQGHARIVVGRKGSGKTAIFYDVRNNEGRGIDSLVLDLKPEGHQFLRLREFIHEKMSLGVAGYTLTGFWTYTLLCEVARKLLEADERIARRDPGRRRDYEALRDAYAPHNLGEEVDFAQRIQFHVERIIDQLESLDSRQVSPELTRLIYLGDIAPLREAIAEYISKKDDVWVLVDNLDKGWPIQESSDTDVQLIRSLLEASRKLQEMIERRDTSFRCLVFLRTDIYEHLLRTTADKGKDTAIRIDWEDPVAFESIIGRRANASTELGGSFREDVWPAICVPLIGTEDSFTYIVDRTLMRPRDLLMFLQRSVMTAINRGHNRVLADDVLFAENGYSNELLTNLQAEIDDTNPELEGVLSVFQSAEALLKPDDAALLIAMQLRCSDEVANAAVRKLIWYGFFGVKSSLFERVVYSYSPVGFSRLTQPLDAGDGMLVVHPAFWSALNIVSG